MISGDVIRLLADLGGLGVLALFLLITFFLARGGMALFRDQVLPLVRNHLEHMETSYEKMSTSVDKNTGVLDGMRRVQEAQALAIDSHNELTRELIQRLPKNHKVKRLLD